MQKKKSAPPRRPLSFDDVREIALSMPEVEEVTAYGIPAFKAGKTRFVRTALGRRPQGASRDLECGVALRDGAPNFGATAAPQSRRATG